MHSFKLLRLSAISHFRCSNHRIGAPVRNIMEFPHSTNSIRDINISIATVSNSQNQVIISHRRSRSSSPTPRSSCPPTVLGIRKCHPREFHHPFQKPEGETPAGSFPRPSCGPSEDSFTRPGHGLQGDSCPRPGDEFIQPCGQVVRADLNFWLTIRNGSAVLARANPSDELQQSVMDGTFCTVKDEAGHSSFSLVNNATGQALKHGLGETQRKYHEEERREHEHHRHGFQPSPEFPPPPRGGEYYHPPGTRLEEPGNYDPPRPPQPYAQGEKYPAHQGFGHVVHHECQRPFQRPECDTPSDAFPRPSYGTSEGSIRRHGHGPTEGSFSRPGYESDAFPRPSYGTSEGSIPRHGHGSTEGSFSRPGYESALPRGMVVRVLCKANPNFWLAIRDGSTVLVHGNANDKFQQWVRDETYSTKVKDETSSPSFSLVNKATCQALKHGLGETQPVLLTQYEPNKFDESILWTTSGDMGQGFRIIRLVNNIHLNLDAFHGDKKSGGIKDGNPIVLWSWKKGDNQLWKIVPF